jgi:hypothetical protein
MASETDSAKEAALAKDLADVLERFASGKKAEALAKGVALALVLGSSPWFALIEPLLARAFRFLEARVSNAAGARAVEAIAREVAEEDGRRRLVAAISGDLEALLRELFTALGRHSEEAVAVSAGDTLARFGILLHRTEDKLIAELAPAAQVWRALSPGIRGLRPDPLPSELLVAAHQTTPYVGRERLFHGLEAWIDGERPVALGFLTGQGGSGKTRLAIEACARWRARGIAAGFLLGDDVSVAERVLAGSDRRVVVIDYADGKPELVRALLQRLSGGIPPTPLLLLARQRGEWWRRLARIPETDPRLVLDACAWKLDADEAELSADERRELWERTVRAISRNSPVPVAREVAPSNRGPKQPLHIMMTALTEVYGPAPSAQPDLLVQVLELEARRYGYLLRAVAKTAWQEDRALDLLRELLAISTLLGGCTRRDLSDAALRRAPALLGEERPNADEYVRILHELYPRQDGVAPLEPDVLGEELVALTTRESPEVIELAASLAADADRRRSLVRVLSRHARRSGDGSRLERLLSICEPSWMSAIVDVAVESADPRDPLVVALDAELRRRGDAAQPLAQELFKQCPADTIALAGIAVAAGRITLAQVRAAARAPDANESARLEFGQLATVLTARLSQIGEHKAALELGLEALEVNRALAERAGLEGRHDASYLSGLAHAFNNLGLCFAACGQFEPALDASGRARLIYEGLSEVNSHYRRYLAASLVNIGTHLEALRRFGPALKGTRRAVDLFRTLVEEEPANFRPKLASSLKNAADHLYRLGRPQEALPLAEEALELIGELERERPDAFLPDLAGSVHTLANCLNAIGRVLDACNASSRAVEIWRKLAEAHPEAFRLKLADALNNLASDLGALERHADAVAAWEEAVEIYRKGADGSEGYRAGLAGSLFNLGKRWDATGDPAAALGIAREAASLSRDLARTQPERFAELAAQTLLQLGRIRSALGQGEVAAASLEEALEQYRALACRNPGVYELAIAHSLDAIDAHCSAWGQLERACDAARECVAIHTRLATAHPDRFSEPLRRKLALLRARLAASAIDPERDEVVRGAERALARCDSNG